MTYSISLGGKKARKIDVNGELLDGSGSLEGILKGIDRELDYLGSGTYRDVYSIGEMVCKITKEELDSMKNHDKQVAIRSEFDFFPAYYGTALFEDNGKNLSLSFYEKIGKMRKRDWKPERIRQAYDIVSKAYDKGYAIDWKHSNFGIKNERIYYIDEGGLGKGALPEDVVEGFETFAKKFESGMKSVPQKIWDNLKKIGKIKEYF